MSEKMNCQGGWNIWGMRGQMIWLAVAVGAWTTNTYGQTAVTWDGTTGAYTTATNWNPDVVPSNAANEFLTINNGGTAQVVTGDFAEGAHLYLGLQPGDTGHLTINGGQMDLGELRVGGFEAIPDLVTPENPPTPNGGGTGTVVQNGGTVNITFTTGVEPPRQSLWVGDAGLASGNTANGSYTITGTESEPAFLLSGIANNDGIFIGTGVGTVGTFTQNAFTTVTSTGFINVGRRGATGTYNLNGGTLNAQAGTGTALFVGDGDTDGISTTSGTVNHAGGTFNVSGSAFIGNRNGEGFYNISGGSLTTTAEIRVGNWPTNVDVSLGNAKGTLTVSGTGSVNIGTNLNVGIGGSGTPTNVMGTLTQTGGEIVLSGTGTTILAVGNGLGTSGTANLSGGSITHTAGSGANIDIGRNSGNGTVNVSGTHALNAKQITLNSSNVAATRQLNISGGTVDVDLVTFGSVASQSTRLLDISGGTVNIGELSTGNATGAGQALTHIRGGNVTIENTLTFFSNSVFRLSDIDLAVPANSTYGNATIDVLGSSTLTLNGTFGTGASPRTLTKTGPGTLTVNGPQSYATNAAAVINDGTINYNSSASGTNLTVTVGSSGTLGGTGTVGGAVTNNGTIAPGVASGTAIGTLTTNANVTNGANSNWAIELNGALSDKLVVNGNIDLSAVDALNVSGSPGASTSWIIGNYTGTLSGVFDTVTSGYSVDYAGGNITLNLAAAGLHGDFNSDGKVDAGDYVTWRKNDGTNNALANDNGLGTPIRADHYNLWRANFGNPPGSGSSLAGASVPEPATWLLIAMAAAVLVIATRRRTVAAVVLEPVRRKWS